MRIDLDAKVRSRDGVDIGTVQRAIVDPTTNQVTQFVISTGGLFGRDVLLPRAEIERATPEGDAVRVGLTRAEIERLPEFLPERYAPPPPDWTMLPTPGLAFPGGYLWPIDYQPAPVERRVPPREAARQPDEVSISTGAVVFARNGEDLGGVEDVRFDERTGRLLGVVLRVGGILETLFGGGTTIEVPPRQIDHVEPNAVFLKVDRDALRREPSTQEA